MKLCEHYREKIADIRKTCPYCNNELSKLEIDIIREFNESVSVMGLVFDADGRLFEKKTGKIANGYFCSYYKTFSGYNVEALKDGYVNLREITENPKKII